MIHIWRPSATAIALASLAIAALAGPVARGEFRVGLQTGISQWKQDLDVQLFDASGSLKASGAGAAGVIGQYLIRANAEREPGYFIGFEASANQESASDRDTFVVLGTPATVTSELLWSTDLLWLGGYDFGQVAVFFSGGVGFVRGETEVTSLGQTGSDKNTHVGWKLGSGVELELGKSSMIQMRASYTIYQDKTYEDQDINLDVEPRAFDLRVSWVYRFSAARLLNALRRQ